jgi:hypothetical protein
MGGTLRMSNFKIWSIFCVFGPQYSYQKCHVLGWSLLKKTQVLTLLSRNLYGRYFYNVKFQNSEYEVHQVGPKNYGSQNFSLLACEAVGVVQFFANGGYGAWQPETFLSCFYAIKSTKTWKSAIKIFHFPRH